MKATGTVKLCCAKWLSQCTVIAKQTLVWKVIPVPSIEDLWLWKAGLSGFVK